jgi:DNA (cytosine-5)-methyltransferase 1
MAPYKILDLFAGAGGLSLGFELLRDKTDKPVFELFRAVELDKFACETLRSWHGADKVIEGDLTKKKIHKRIISECKGKVALVVGGIPCQSFSLIGPRSGFGKKMEKFKKDERDHLYKEFKAIVAELMPNIVVIENVKGILSKKNARGKIIDKIIKEFENLGYIFENELGKKYFVLNAANFGVPQKRERVILIGVLKTWLDIKIPVIQPTHSARKIKGGKLLPYVTLSQAIGGLPKLEAKTTNTDVPKKKLKEIKKNNKKINNGTDRIDFDRKDFEKQLNKINNSGKQFLNFIRPNGYKYLDNHVARSQQSTDIKLFKKMYEGETAGDYMKRNPKMAKKLIKYTMNSFKDKYRKQRWNEPSTTIFAHLEKDGNRFIHPRQARTITPREAARLQSFPDDRVFCGPISKKFKQIGNAVPPLMGNNIAKNVYEIIGKKQ